MISPCIEKELPLQASHSEKCTPHCLGLCKSGSFKQYFGHCSCLMLQCEISPEAVKRPPVFRRFAWYIVCSKHFPCFYFQLCIHGTFALFVDCIAIMRQFCSHFESTTLEFARRCDCCHWLPLAVLCSWVHWPRSWHRKPGQMWVTLIALHGGMASLQLIAANLKCSRIVGWHCGGCWVQSCDG